MAANRTAVRQLGAGYRADIEFDSAGFMASLTAAVAAIEISSEAGLWALAIRVQNVARSLAPVDTGRLRSSIMATKGRDGNGPFVDIGTNVYYAVFIEFGTIHMAAQPFLRPAMATAVGLLPSAIRAAQ